MAHGNFVALFDILGFEQRLARFGLAEMLARYEDLIDSVNYRKEHAERVFGNMGMAEAPHWLPDGDVFLFTKTHGAYASDSILLWADRTWPDARNISEEDSLRLATNTADGWMHHPIPCDNFLDVCNDLMCRGLEVGLPLRGAIAIGEAALIPDRNIFLGQPIVEAARIESGQQFIGAGFCKSALNQVVPARYALPFERHIKESHKDKWSGTALDWPRHWRSTRKWELSRVVAALNVDPKFSSYYENTLDFIEYSKQFSNLFESAEEISIRSNYPQFSWSNSELAVTARAVRRIPINPDA
jgi:hypothetical protein